MVIHNQRSHPIPHEFDPSSGVTAVIIFMSVFTLLSLALFVLRGSAMGGVRGSSVLEEIPSATNDTSDNANYSDDELILWIPGTEPPADVSTQ